MYDGQLAHFRCTQCEALNEYRWNESRGDWAFEEVVSADYLEAGWISLVLITVLVPLYSIFRYITFRATRKLKC